MHIGKATSSIAYQRNQEAQCLKIAQKVSYNIASEASYVYILSGQKFIVNLASFWKAEACGQTVLPYENWWKIQTFKYDILNYFQAMWGSQRSNKQNSTLSRVSKQILMDNFANLPSHCHLCLTSYGSSKNQLKGDLHTLQKRDLIWWPFEATYEACLKLKF